MSIRKRFNKIFGLGDNVEVERNRFVQRVNDTVFTDIDTNLRKTVNYDKLFYKLCFELGINSSDLRKRQIRGEWGVEEIPPAIRTLTKDDFTETLLVLCILYHYLEDTPKIGRKLLSDLIEYILSRCSCDIGVRWKEGFFHPTGAEELDESLIEETLNWLNDYPGERKDYQKALECSLRDNSLTDVIDNCYLAIEGMAREVLGNQKTLDNNKNELLRKMNLSDGWKSILATYINYAHNYRHASGQRHEITKQEAEAYLYMTGLIIRLIIESK